MNAMMGNGLLLKQLMDCELMIPLGDGTEKSIYSLSLIESKKAPGVQDCLADGNQNHQHGCSAVKVLVT